MEGTAAAGLSFSGELRRQLARDVPARDGKSRSGMSEYCDTFDVCSALYIIGGEGEGGFIIECRDVARCRICIDGSFPKGS